MVCGTQVMYVMKKFRSIHIYTRLFNLVARSNPNRMEEDVYTLPRFQKWYSTKIKTKIIHVSLLNFRPLIPLPDRQLLIQKVT